MRIVIVFAFLALYVGIGRGLHNEVLEGQARDVSLSSRLLTIVIASQGDVGIEVGGGELRGIYCERVVGGSAEDMRAKTLAECPTKTRAMIH